MSKIRTINRACWTPLFDGSFVMLLPEHFAQMPDEIAKVRYINIYRPPVILSGPDYDEKFGFHLLAGTFESGVISEDCVETPVDFLLQHKETDWEFVKRIASRFGLAVTPEIRREGPFYYVGNQHYDEYALPDQAKCRVSRYVGAFMQHSANGEGAPREQDYVEYQVSAREIYNLWDVLRTRELHGHIYRIHSEYCKGELIHTYFLRQKEAFKVLPTFNECQQGCSFQAEVKAVMQDKVQIALRGDENADQKIVRWFPYSTGYSSPDGAGWYCMPEVGDRVRLQIPDHVEEHGYVISAVHLETGHDRKIPDHKSFKTKYGKELLFTPDSLELTNNQGMSVKILDGKGIQLVSNKDISIIAGGNMTISSQDASLIIAGTKSVDVRQGSIWTATSHFREESSEYNEWT